MHVALLAASDAPKYREFMLLAYERDADAFCVFRRSVTDRFGIVTAEFGIVTGHFGDVTDGRFALA